MLYGEGGELAVFIIDNEAYDLNKVLVPSFNSYVLIYTLIPIGIQDAIDMLRNLGVEVSP
jgi:hypothetical protein